MGNGKMAERGGGRRDFFGDGGDGRPRGSPLPVLVGVRRDGCPHARGQRESSRRRRGARLREDDGGLRLHGGSGGEGEGSPHARATREGMGCRPASSRGQDFSVSGGTGMGPRIREDNGRGWSSRLRLHGGSETGGTGMGPRIREDNGRGWIPDLIVFRGQAAEDGEGDGSPHSHRKAVSGGMGTGRVTGDVASARMNGRG